MFGGGVIGRKIIRNLEEGEHPGFCTVKYVKNQLYMTKPIVSGITSTLMILHAHLLSAQPESESVYSDQAYDPIANPAWYESPYLWIGLVAILAIILLFLRQRSRRSRKFMDPGKEE